MEESHAPRSRIARRASLLASLLAASFFSAHAIAAEVFHFDIPAGNAEDTLQMVTRQTNYTFLYQTEEVRGVRTNSVSGDFEPQEALRRMLEGTTLAFDIEAGVVSPMAVATVPEAKRLDDRGPGTAAITPRGLPNLANSLSSVDPAELQEVVVTGTLIRGVFDIVSPLVMFENRQIRRAGYGSVRDALQSLTMTFGGGPSEYVEFSENFNRGAAINLRGLGAGATLVLVDGRRQPFAGNDGNFVDISSIPWSAVERVEVLPDGSSALYGSDAIAGVVNIIMKSDFTGAETQARVGMMEGGGDETVASQLFGTSWASGRLFFAYQFSERGALAASARDYTANSDKRSFGGTNFSSVRSNPGNIFDLRTQQPAFAIPRGQDGTSLTLDELIPGAINYTNRMENTELFPDRQTHSLFLSLSHSLGERMELFGEGRVSDRVIEQTYPASDRLFVVPGSNPFNPFGNTPVVVGYDFTNDLGRVSSEGRTRSYVGTLGMRKDIGESWKATLAATYGTERMRWSARNLPNLEALGIALADRNRDTAFNPFGDGSANNPGTIESIRESQRERAVSEVTAVNVVADGELMKLSPGAAKLAIGIDFREERLDHGVRKQQAFGRQVSSAFAELALPLIGNAENPRDTPRLQLSLAARGENYSDFGTTFNPKVGLQWVPVSSLKLRGSWGTSFKAPSLVDLYDTTDDLASIFSLRDALSPTGRSIALIQQGSNSELSEERAETWTAGIDFAPSSIPGSTLSLTLYSIQYDDRVFFLGPPLTPEQIIAQPQWASLITRNPAQDAVASICNSGIFPGNPQQCLAANPSILIDARSHNLSATTVEGVDLDLDHVLDTSRGVFTLGLHGSYMWRFEQQLTRDASKVDILNTVDNPVSLRLRGSVEWDQHGADRPGFGVGVSVDHIGGYADSFSQTTASIDSWTRLNVNVSYRLAGIGDTDGLEFILSGLNIFDDHPPFVDREMGFDVANAEPFGRVVSFHLRKNW
jgi:iron complex outermembrane recepter protein